MIIGTNKTFGEFMMNFDLPKLPYDRSALEPFISAKTIDFHYGKHHNAYVNNLNKLIKGTEYANLSLEGIIKKSYKDETAQAIFNNAAQVWNHTFFWNCMKPNGGSAPKGELATKINNTFGSYEEFIQKFKHDAATQFGSGWVWLVDNNGKLEIVKTANADTPVARGQKPLMTIDVWEHAYYLDYQNRRPDFISTFVEKLINWDNK
jgi:Fe-Mn family superoxide dismutase